MFLIDFSNLLSFTIIFNLDWQAGVFRYQPLSRSLVLFGYKYLSPGLNPILGEWGENVSDLRCVTVIYQTLIK